MIMEYIPGENLRNILENIICLEETRVFSIIIQIVEALEYLHGNGIVHGDIKLENFIIYAENKIKICDFGFSRFFIKGNLINDHCGSFYYCSPEVINGKSYDGTSNDIWALGVCILIMTIGYN